MLQLHKLYLQFAYSCTSSFSSFVFFVYAKPLLSLIDIEAIEIAQEEAGGSLFLRRTERCYGRNLPGMVALRYWILGEQTTWL